MQEDRDRVVVAGSHIREATHIPAIARREHRQQPEQGMLGCMRSACQGPSVDLLVDQGRRDGEPRRGRPTHPPGQFQRRFVPNGPGELVTPQIAGHLGRNLYLTVANPPTTEGT
jgi:hypothetical protein